MLGLQGPWKLMQDGHSKFGDAFTVPVAHKRVTFLIGPDVAPHFFKATDDEMSQTEVRLSAAGQTKVNASHSDASCCFIRAMVA